MFSFFLAQQEQASLLSERKRKKFILKTRYTVHLKKARGKKSKKKTKTNKKPETIS